MAWIAVGIGTQAAIVGGQYLASRHRRKKDEANRPEYEVPEEVGQGLRKAQTDALYGLPDAQKRQAEESFKANQAYSLGQSSSRKGGLTSVAALNRNAGQFSSNMAAQDAMAMERKQGAVYGQLQNVANYEDMAFQYNTSSPYYEGIASREADAGALAQGLSRTASLATSALSGMPAPTPDGVAKSAPASSPFQYNGGFVPSSPAPNNPAFNGGYNYMDGAGQSGGYSSV